MFDQFNSVKTLCEIIPYCSPCRKALAADTSMGGEGNAAADEDQDEEVCN